MKERLRERRMVSRAPRPSSSPREDVREIGKNAIAAPAPYAASARQVRGMS